jgi:hypothetical protein
VPWRTPTISAAAYPSKMARSSAKASLRAASFAACRSESFAPRSTSSNHLPIEVERNAQLHKGFYFTLLGGYADFGRLDHALVTCAYGRQRGARSAVDIHNPATGKTPLDRPCRLFFYLSQKDCGPRERRRDELRNSKGCRSPL